MRCHMGNNRFHIFSWFPFQFCFFIFIWLSILKIQTPKHTKKQANLWPFLLFRFPLVANLSVIDIFVALGFPSFRFHCSVFLFSVFLFVCVCFNVSSLPWVRFVQFATKLSRSDDPCGKQTERNSQCLIANPIYTDKNKNRNGCHIIQSHTEKSLNFIRDLLLYIYLWI